MVIYGVAARLNDKNVSPAHVFEDLKINLAVTEASEAGFAQRHFEMRADALRQRQVRSPREDFETVVVHDTRAPSVQLLGCTLLRPNLISKGNYLLLWRRCGSTEDKRKTPIDFNECPAFYERTCRARVSRKQRSDRPETQQRLGAPSLGSGKLQTPPNRYPPTRLLQLLFEARPA